MKHVAFLDFETTGLIPEEGEVIEAAVVLVSLTADYQMGEILEEYQSLNDPLRPIPPPISRLTGITDDAVKGQQLDWTKLKTICDRCDLIVAHNARFDRAWLEKAGYRTPKKWGCSRSMIRWKDSHGMPCGHLKHLAWEHQYFPNAHRAMDDVKSLMKLLGMPSIANPLQTYFQELLACVEVRWQIVFANRAPFEAKDKLKGQQFRWSGNRRVWWKLVSEKDLPEVSRFLTKEIYAGVPGFAMSDPVDPLDPRLEEKLGL